MSTRLRQVGEEIARLNPLMLGPAKAYRSIPADAVAGAMITAAGTGRTGRHIHTYRQFSAGLDFGRVGTRSDSPLVQ